MDETAAGITGYVVSEKFRGMDQPVRQALIDEILTDPLADLDAEETKTVHAITAFTPEEYAARRPRQPKEAKEPQR